MAGTSRYSATLANYPRKGTFGELLNWHLSWGTKPEGSTTEPNTNKRWVKSKFAQFVHAEGFDIESAKRSLRYWTNEGVLPEEHDQDKLDRIYRELFDDDPNLKAWKADLEQALERGRKHQAARIAKRDIADVAEVSHVPRPTAHFMGRDDDVETFAQALVSSDTPPAILIQGGPGIGKTELTKAIAYHPNVAARFGERRYFVPLETTTSAAAMQDAIIRAIGGDPRQGFAAALRSLGDRGTLLILDNLETPWELTAERVATEQILADLASRSGVTILASFRGLEPVGGPRWTEHSLQELPHAIASALFASIAGRRVIDDPDLENFLDALGGLPLAIKLVARRAHGRSNLAPLWREWTKLGADFAADPDREMERLTSLPHSLELSLRSRRITEPALRLFRLLGVLPAGLAYEDAESLLGDETFEATERLCHLGIVEEKRARLVLLPPIREHARRHHRPEGRDLDNWIDHFLGLLERAARAPDGLSTSCDLSRGLGELRNIEAALRELISRGQDAIAISYLEYYQPLIIYSRADTSLFKKIISFSKEKDSPTYQAIYLYRLGKISYARSDDRSARMMLQESLTLFSKLNRPDGEADCLEVLGDIALARGETADAESSFERALSLRKQVGDTYGELNCLLSLGNVAIAQSLDELAHENFARALSISHAINDAAGAAASIQGIGSVAVACEEFETALFAFKQAASIFNQMGDSAGEASCVARMGDTAYASADFELAKKCYEKALSIYMHTGILACQAECIKELGMVALAMSNHDLAKEKYSEALSQYRQMQDSKGTADCLMGLGDVAVASAKFCEARLAFEEALTIYGEIDRSDRIAICSAKIAKLP